MNFLWTLYTEQGTSSSQRHILCGRSWWLFSNKERKVLGLTPGRGWNSLPHLCKPATSKMNWCSSTARAWGSISKRVQSLFPVTLPAVHLRNNFELAIKKHFCVRTSCALNESLPARVFFFTLQMTFYSNSMLTFICLTTAGAFIANAFGSYQFLFYSLSFSLFLMWKSF